MTSITFEMNIKFDNDQFRLEDGTADYVEINEFIKERLQWCLDSVEFDGSINTECCLDSSFRDDNGNKVGDTVGTFIDIV